MPGESDWYLEIECLVTGDCAWWTYTTGAFAAKLLPPRLVLPMALKPCGVVLPSRQELSLDWTGLITFFSLSASSPW